MGEFLTNLYERFVLRDLFGKIVPGTILTLTVILCATSPDKVMHAITVKEFPLITWVIFFGVAWVMAFGVQSLGERLRLIRYHGFLDPEGRPDDLAFTDRTREFMAVATPTDRQQRERYVVIKEACGNMYVTLALCWLLFFLDGLMHNYFFAQADLREWIKFELMRNGHLFAFGALMIFMLARMHCEHVRRQDRMSDRVVEMARRRQAPPYFGF